MLNMLVMVDEFTVENGATKVVPGAHLTKERQDEQYLADNAVRATGKAASYFSIQICGIPQPTTLPRYRAWRLP